METMVKVIIGLIVLVIVIWGFSAGYKKITSLGGLEWDDLSLSEQGKVQTSMNDLVMFLKNCSTKSNCFCGKTNGFPFPFDDQQKIIIEPYQKGKSKITFMWKNVPNREEEIIEKDIFLNQLVNEKMEINFTNSEYFINGENGATGRPAFYNINGALFIFDDIFEIGVLQDTKKDCTDKAQFESAFCQSLKFKQC
ncbi:MAG: hypothetical protein KKE23_00370 [Nanoarchaeota archaeon]|nr:hypothetical protein [Nanoarchaeota archaeon]